MFDSWTIYSNPTDAPGLFVMRRFHNGEPTPEAVSCPLLEPLREFAESLGLVCITRSEHDEPQIVETWI